MLRFVAPTPGTAGAGAVRALGPAVHLGASAARRPRPGHCSASARPPESIARVNEARTASTSRCCSSTSSTSRRCSAATSVTRSRPASRSLESFLDRFPATVELAHRRPCSSRSVVGIPLGYLAARHQGRLPRHRRRCPGRCSGSATPVFFLAILLKLVFADWLGWLPTALRQDATHRRHAHHQLLRPRRVAHPGVGRDARRDGPPGAARRSRSAPSRWRSSSGSPGPRSPRCSTRTTSAPPSPRGSAERTVVAGTCCATRCCRSSRRSACRPGCCSPARCSPRRVFAFNGIGRYLFEAIAQRDYPVLQGFIIFIAMIYSLINLLVDIALRPDRPEGEGP